MMINAWVRANGLSRGGGTLILGEEKRDGVGRWIEEKGPVCVL